MLNNKYKWSNLDIGNKLRAVFCVILTLFLLLIATFYICFIFVINAEDDIALTNKLSLNILEINLGLEKSQKSLNNFLHNYEQIGLRKAHEQYAQPAIREMAQVISLSSKLKNYIDNNVHFPIKVSETDINLFLASAKRFSDTSIQAIELITRRATPQSGLESQLQSHSDQISSMLHPYPRLQELHRRCRFLYKDYLTLRTRSLIQEIYNLHTEIEQHILSDPNIHSNEQELLITSLNSWDEIATELLDVDLQLSSIKNDFSLQKQTLEPISQQLVRNIHQITDMAEQQIKRAYTVTQAIIFLLSLITLLIIIKTASLLHNSITKNILHLTTIAEQFSKGDLNARAQLTSHDELGILSKIFNTMVSRIQELVGNLESEVRHQTQELQTFKSIFDTANYGSAILNLNGHLTYANNYFAKIHGYEPHEIANKHFTFFHNAEQRSSAEDLFAFLLENNVFETTEVWHTHKDGTPFPMLMAGTLIHDNHGTPKSLAVTALDITEQKLAEQEKLHIEAQYYQAQKMESVGRLAGGVAHDFNNMLSVILGFAEISKASAGTNDQLKSGLEEIIIAGRKSADLVRQLLAFSRKQTIAPQKVDCNKKLQESKNMLKRLIGEDVHLHYNLDENLGPIHIDPSQFDQIIANLAVNARDAIANTGSIKISTSNITFSETYNQGHTDIPANEYAMLSFEDDGCGMGKETIKQIFEPFFTTKEVGKGTGLGMSTVFGIVKQNSGAVNVYSEVGHGSVIKIYFPLYKKNETDNSAKSDPFTNLMGTETILVVEDEPSLLRLCKTILSNLGYTVITEKNSPKAVELVQQNPEKFDLLLTDVIMPEMNGNQLRQAIEEIQPTIKTLFMSGYTAEVIAYQGVVAQGVNFIQKPFSKQTLGEKIRTILDAQQTS